MKKQEKLMIGIILIVCIGFIFYNFQGRDPYKKYNHIQSSEIMKVSRQRYWVYFYSMDNQESIDSSNGITRLMKATGNLYFVNIKDKKSEFQPTTLLYIKNHQIIKEYKGLKELKNKRQEILEMNW